MNFLLKIKHWQLFLLVIIAPILIAVTVSGLNITSEPIFPLIPLLMFLTYFSWIWTICIGLTTHLTQELSVRVSIINILGTLLIVSILFRFWIEFINGEHAISDSSLIDILDAIFVILSLAFMNLAAKIFKSAELHKSTRFSEHIGEFFLIWFFPLGIWNLQPRINRIAKQNWCQQALNGRCLLAICLRHELSRSLVAPSVTLWLFICISASGGCLVNRIGVWSFCGLVHLRYF